METSSPSGESDDWPPGQGNFGYFTRLEFNSLNPAPITAIAFDPIEEIIWCGNANVSPDFFKFCYTVACLGKDSLLLWGEQLQQVQCLRLVYYGYSRH